MDSLLLAALMGLGGAAYAYLIQSINKLEKRIEVQDVRIERLQFLLGVKDRAYQRMKRVAQNEKFGKMQAQEQNASLRQRLTVDMLRDFDSREGKSSA